MPKCGGNEVCYSWSTPGADQDGPTEILARKLSLDLTENSGGRALKIIIDAGH
jgi:hypothetical protein